MHNNYGQLDSIALVISFVPWLILLLLIGTIKLESSNLYSPPKRNISTKCLVAEKEKSQKHRSSPTYYADPKKLFRLLALRCS